VQSDDSSPRQRFRFPKHRRLLRRKEFLLVQRKGKRFHVGPLITCVRFVDDQPSRVGITTSKRVGPAFVRTRIRRLIREAARRLLLPTFPNGIEVVFIAKNGLPYSLTQSEVDEAVNELIKRLTKRINRLS
jgi:ribonuclease P protein component